MTRNCDITKKATNTIYQWVTVHTTAEYGAFPSYIGFLPTATKTIDWKMCNHDIAIKNKHWGWLKWYSVNISLKGDSA